MAHLLADAEQADGAAFGGFVLACHIDASAQKEMEGESGEAERPGGNAAHLE
jgi:hypothetical protein